MPLLRVRVQTAHEFDGVCVLVVSALVVRKLCSGECCGWNASALLCPFWESSSESERENDRQRSENMMRIRPLNVTLFKLVECWLHWGFIGVRVGHYGQVNMENWSIQMISHLTVKIISGHVRSMQENLKINNNLRDVFLLYWQLCRTEKMIWVTE